VKNVGKPCEGEPHARIDGRELETERISGHGHGEEQPTGNRAVPNGSVTYHRTMPPRQLSTLHRHVVSAKVFNELDYHLWKLAYKWARHSHPHKGKRWITSRYFGAFNSARRDRWVFGDRDSGAYLLKFAWTTITRHTLIKGWASPDDPTLTDYWASRRRRGRPPLDRARLRMIQRQRGRCALCGQLLLHTDHEPAHPDEWEQWITATRKALSHHALTLDTAVLKPGQTDTITVFRLIHTHCQNRQPNGAGKTTSTPAALT
jgi:RNA-directed DNA polymerase